MSRNDLFLLLACAIVATIISGSPSPLARSSSVTIASLIAPPDADPALPAPPFDPQQSAR